MRRHGEAPLHSQAASLAFRGAHLETPRGAQSLRTFWQIKAKAMNMLSRDEPVQRRCAQILQLHFDLTAPVLAQAL